MKRLWIGAFIICGLAPLAAAQRGGGARGGGIGRGGGGIGFRGRGFGQFAGNRWAQNWGQFGGYGGYGGYGGEWGYPFGDADQPVVLLPVNVAPPEPPELPPPPPQPARPVILEYHWPDTGVPSATTFTILSKDGTMRSAIAVWVQDGELRYKAPDGAGGRMDVGAIDREATARLNAEHGLKLWLPSRR